MNPHTYFAIIIPRGKPTIEHGRITAAIERLSAGQLAPPFGDAEKLTYIFNSSESHPYIHSQLDTACLDGDRFLLVQIAIETKGAASSGGLTAIADWLNKKGIPPRQA